MSILDSLTDADATDLRIFIARSCSVFAAVEVRARQQARDYPDAGAGEAEARRLREVGEREAMALTVLPARDARRHETRERQR